jgi:FkbM family methyltransferase
VDQFVSYAQNGEDVILWRALGHVRDGRYVDVGAAGPETDSVTKAFCQRGWRGIDVEPLPEYARQLRADRPSNEVWQAVVSDKEVGEVTLHVSADTELSTLDDRIAAGNSQFEQVDVMVPAKTLDAICEESALLDGALHFLKIDVEGAEFDVLRSVTLSRWRPWVVVVEATQPNSTSHSFGDWEPLLTTEGYTFTLFDGLNRYYVSPDHPELREALSYPACSLDNFVTADAKSAAAELQEARREMIRWRNLAITGFAESTSLAQRESRRARRLERKVNRLERALKAGRARNKRLAANLAILNTHFEVRARRKLGRMTRRLRGRS